MPSLSVRSMKSSPWNVKVISRLTAFTPGTALSTRMALEVSTSLAAIVIGLSVIRDRRCSTLTSVKAVPGW